MRTAHVLGALSFLMLLVVAARPADACGTWNMTDKEKSFDIRWDISSAGISKVTGNKSARRVAAFYLDVDSKDAPRVVSSKQVIFDVKDGKLRKRGKAVATVDDTAGTITFGKRTYTIAFTDEKDWHGMPAWTMTVKRGDTVVLESTEATALCAPLAKARTGQDMSKDEQQLTIRRRVQFYLAWRELGL